jgi:hypothetical protein
VRGKLMLSTSTYSTVTWQHNCVGLNLIWSVETGQMADYKVYGKYNTQVFSNVTICRNFNRYRRFGEYKCLSNVDNFISLRGVTSKKTRNFMNTAVETTIPQKTDVLIYVRLRHSWLIRTGTRKGRIILRSWLFLMCSGYNSTLR